MGDSSSGYSLSDAVFARAIALDNGTKQNAAAALILYKEGLTILLDTLELDSNPISKERFTAHAQTFINRIRVLEELNAPPLLSRLQGAWTLLGGAGEGMLLYSGTAFSLQMVTNDGHLTAYCGPFRLSSDLTSIEHHVAVTNGALAKGTAHSFPIKCEFTKDREHLTLGPLVWGRIKQ